MYRDTRRTGARSTYTTYYYTVNTYRVGFTIFTVPAVISNNTKI